MRRLEMILLKVHIIFFLIVQGAAAVGFCMNNEIRDEMKIILGVDMVLIGIAGMAAGIALMIKISEYEKKRRMSG